MGKCLVACALGAAVALASGSASAQRRTATPGPRGEVGPQSMTLQKEQLGTAGFATLARTRMRNGDCAGALDVFDLAVLHSIDPTLRRDRGLCHEQLGHPFPAMDDYRAYLAVVPDAPDSDGIRQRLSRLEADTAGATAVPTAKPAVDDDVPPPNDDVPPPGASASSGFQISASTGEEHDRMEYTEHDNDVLSSPLRRGKGFSLAPYYAQHKWFFEGSDFGEPDTWSESVGAQVRYSFGRVPTLVAEVAYEHFNVATATANAPIVPSITGVATMLGLELRFPLDAEYNNQLFILPGLGFEALSFAYSDGSSNQSLYALVPKARVGWRHMISNSVGFDLSLEGGAGKFTQGSDFPFNGPGNETPLLAMNLGLVWGL